jgi:hypothetical protein
MGNFNIFNPATWNVNNRQIGDTEEIIPEGESTPSKGLVYNAPEMFGVNLKNWVTAVDQAWSETDPNRIELSDIYKAIVTYDSQTIASMTQRKLLVSQGDVAFYNEDGTVNEEATKLIVSPSGSTHKWFKNFMSYTLDSIFWGYELISVNVKNGKVLVKKVPERNVIPQDNLIIKDASVGMTESNVIEYNRGKYDLVTCKVSYTDDKFELGLLSGVAPMFFSKVTGSWKHHADRYGLLTRVLKTNSSNKQKLEASYKAMQNHARGSFIIMNEDDEFTFEGDTRSNMSIYKDLNEYCDKSISKIILGQTGTTDEKSFSGSSSVHKSILESIVKSDREFLESVVNDQLISKLQMFGVLPENVYFGISDLVEVDQEKQAKVIKTLTDAGFKPTQEYVEKTFNMPLDISEPIKEEKEEENNDNTKR